MATSAALQLLKQSGYDWDAKVVSRQTFCNLDSASMKRNGRIAYTKDVESKLYRYCTYKGISAHALPQSGGEILDMMVSIGFDTPDAGVYLYACLKILTWIQRHVTSDKMDGVLEEEPIDDTRKSSPWRTRWKIDWSGNGSNPFWGEWVQHPDTKVSVCLESAVRTKLVAASSSAQQTAVKAIAMATPQQVSPHRPQRTLSTIAPVTMPQFINRLRLPGTPRFASITGKMQTFAPQSTQCATEMLSTPQVNTINSPHISRTQPSHQIATNYPCMWPQPPPTTSMAIPQNTSLTAPTSHACDDQNVAMTQALAKLGIQTNARRAATVSEGNMTGTMPPSPVETPPEFIRLASIECQTHPNGLSHDQQACIPEPYPSVSQNLLAELEQSVRISQRLRFQNEELQHQLEKTVSLATMQVHQQPRPTMHVNTPLVSSLNGWHHTGPEISSLNPVNHQQEDPGHPSNSNGYHHHHLPSYYGIEPPNPTGAATALEQPHPAHTTFDPPHPIPSTENPRFPHHLGQDSNPLPGPRAPNPSVSPQQIPQASHDHWLNPLLRGNAQPPPHHGFPPVAAVPPHEDSVFSPRPPATTIAYPLLPPLRPHEVNPSFEPWSPPRSRAGGAGGDVRGGHGAGAGAGAGGGRGRRDGVVFVPGSVRDARSGGVDRGGRGGDAAAAAADDDDDDDGEGGGELSRPGSSSLYSPPASADGFGFGPWLHAG